MASNVEASDGVIFGEKMIFSSDRKVSFDLSDDKKAFEIRFDPALAVGVGTPVFDGLAKTAAPVSTRVYAAVIAADGKKVETSFVLNGFGSTEPGTNTTVVLAVNDQHSVTRFASGKEDDAFTVALPYRAKKATDFRITVLLIAERDAEHPDATALLAVNDISADTVVGRTKRRPSQ